MNPYLKLIREKQNVVDELHATLSNIEYEQHRIYYYMPQLREQFEEELLKLKKLKKESLESGISAFVLSSSVAAFLLFLTSLSFWMNLGIHFITSSLICLASSFASLGIGLFSAKIINMCFKRWRQRNCNKFVKQEDVVDSICQQIDTLKDKYDRFTDQKMNIYCLIDKQEKDIKLLNEKFMSCLMQVDNKMLDGMIAEEIAKRNNPVIDIDIKRNRSF